VRVAASRAALAAAVIAGSRRALERRYQAFTRAVIHWQRLQQISAQVPAPASTQGEAEIAAAEDRHAGRMMGFHLPESYQSAPIRWSGPAAIVELPPPGEHDRIVIDCAAVREPLEHVRPMIFINATPVPRDRVLFDRHSAVISLDGQGPGPLRLAWFCKPFPAPGDKRRLGLPVHRIALTGS
jgi:hypothetical protein